MVYSAGFVIQDSRLEAQSGALSISLDCADFRAQGSAFRIPDSSSGISSQGVSRVDAGLIYPQTHQSVGRKPLTLMFRYCDCLADSRYCGLSDFTTAKNAF